jgi:hypothetical protein
MKSHETLLENLHNLAALCLDFIDTCSGQPADVDEYDLEDEEVWRRHLLTVEHAIRLICSYYEMWEEMDEMIQLWKEEEE